MFWCKYNFSKKYCLVKQRQKMKSAIKKHVRCYEVSLYFVHLPKKKFDRTPCQHIKNCAPSWNLRIVWESTPIWYCFHVQTFGKAVHLELVQNTFKNGLFVPWKIFCRKRCLRYHIPASATTFKRVSWEVKDFSSTLRQESNMQIRVVGST